MHSALLHVVAFMIAGIALCLGGIAASPARGAEVRVVEADRFDDLHNGSIDVDSGLGNNLRPDGNVICNIDLRGPIEAGDLGRLKAALGQIRSRHAMATPRVCLSSGGGNYQEGLAISRFFMDENIGTAIPAGAECHSSCALMFMGGSFPWKGHINRFLDAGGVVGFHAPYVAGLKDQSYPSESVKVAFDEGVRAISDLMKLGVGSPLKRFPPELLDELLQKGPNEVFEIDTVGKAIRLRVHLYGIANPLIVSEQTLCNACVNMKYGAFETYGRGAKTDLCASPGTIDRKRTVKGMRFVYEVAPRGGSCVMDVAMERSSVQGWMYQVDEKGEWQDGLELAYWFLYPPNTRLADLSGRGPRPARPLPPTVRKEQSTEREELVRRIVNFVSIDYLGHGRLNHESRAALYAPQIVYFDKGTLSRDQVVADKRAYYARWPSRKYEMIENSLTSKSGAGDSLDVSFRYQFEVSDGKRTVSGTGTTTIGLVSRDGRFLIVRETGQVDRRAPR